MNKSDCVFFVFFVIRKKQDVTLLNCHYMRGVQCKSFKVLFGYTEGCSTKYKYMHKLHKL